MWCFLCMCLKIWECFIFQTWSAHCGCVNSECHLVLTFSFLLLVLPLFLIFLFYMWMRLLYLYFLVVCCKWSLVGFLVCLNVLIELWSGRCNMSHLDRHIGLVYKNINSVNITKLLIGHR